MIYRYTDEDDPFQALEDWNRSYFIWLFIGILLLIIPGLFSLFCLRIGLKISNEDKNKKHEKDYWISSDTDEYDIYKEYEEQELHND